MSLNRLRRLLMAGLVALTAICVAPPAFAGNYLDVAALLLDEARTEGDMLQPRTTDKEMVLIVQMLTSAREKAGAKMEVPAAVAKAHPHLLLMLDNYERAADAAAAGNFKDFLKYTTTARDEDGAFRAVITELGYTLPEVRARR
jgi:hypothetical protein